MKASLLSFRFIYNSYNSLISQILQLANDNPSFYSSIRILKVLFTDRKCFALIAAYLNHWISGKNQKQLFQCLYSFPHLMPLKDWSSKLRRIYALLCAAKQLALSSLRIDATKCHFKDCLACYGSSMQQNARIGSTVLINLIPREKKKQQLLSGTGQSWPRRPVCWLSTASCLQPAKDSDLEHEGYCMNMNGERTWICFPLLPTWELSLHHPRARSRQQIWDIPRKSIKAGVAAPFTLSLSQRNDPEFH